MEDLDKLFHQPVRTRIAAYLAARGESTFSDLKQALKVTDGNLEAHVKKLTAAGYLNSHKDSGEGRTQTLYSLSDAGEVAFRRYVETLQALLRLE